MARSPVPSSRNWHLQRFRILAYTKAVDKPEGVPAAPEEDPRHTLRKFKAGVFQVLANPTRIHIVECLSAGELTVSAIIEQVAIEPANASQHLSILRSKGLVVNRKVGNQVFYSLRDPLLIEVLDTMKRYFKAHLEESTSMLKGMEN